MKKRRSAFLLEKLEPRLLFSADLALLPVDGGALSAGQGVELNLPHLTVNSESQRIDSFVQLRHEIVFIDSGVENYQQLLGDLQAQNGAGRDLEVVVLTGERDGIEQISDSLRFRQDISAVHIISHGSDGEVLLGNAPLNLATLDAYAAQLEGWQTALNSDADLLFYGCNLASGTDGQALIGYLSLLTGADVAASDDLTGQAALGGDWILEYRQGAIETDSAFSTVLQNNWQGVLDVISGTAFANEGIAPLADGTTIHLLINGSEGGTGIVSGGAGAFSIDTLTVPIDPVVGDTLVLFIDGDPINKGTTVTVTDGGNLSNVDVYAGHLITRYDDGGGSMTNALMAAAKGASVDPDILYSVSAGDLTVTGPGTVLYVPNGETFTPGGNVTTPALKSVENFNAGAFDVTVNGDMTLIGGGQFTLTTGSLTVNGLFSSDAHFVGGSGAVDINGSLNILGSTFDATTGNTTVSGNFSVAGGGGAFHHNNGTVVLDGTGQNLVGSPHFFNLVKVTTSADTLTFKAGDRITIDTGGTLTLTGTSGQLLTLASSTPGAAWELDIKDTATVTMNFVNIADCDVSPSDASQKPVTVTNSIDGGGNLDPGQWDFTLVNDPPVGGYSVANIIPAAQITQSTDGTGLVTITWKGVDVELNSLFLNSFQYSDDGGLTWYTPMNGDLSEALTTNWRDNGGVGWSSADDFAFAPSHSFTFNTKHADVAAVQSLDNTDQSDIQVHFILNDGTSNSLDPATSENFRVDNLRPTPTITGATYQSTPNKLRMQGTNFTTIAPIGTDVKAYIDWSKLVIDINSDGATTPDITFTLADISDATIDSDGSLEIKLTTDAALTLEGNPNFGPLGGADLLIVSAGFTADAFGNVSITDSTVNDPPSATNLNASETYIEDTPLNFVNDIVISDPDGGYVSANLTLSDPAAGSLSVGTINTATSTYNASTGLWQVSGEIADVNTLLAGLVFTPASNYASNFSIAVSIDDGVSASVTGTMAVTATPQNDLPVLGNNTLSITEGSTVVLDGSMLSATDIDNADPGLTFTVSSITGGQFERISTSTVVTSFTQADITAGDIQFVHDGNEAAPTYSVSVSDGSLSTTAAAATISFTNQNDIPTLGSNSLTITEGATVILNGTMLSATDIDNADPSLTFTVSSVTGGQFERISTGTVVTSLTQADITAGDIQFVHDGNEAAPTYSVSVSDGSLSTAAAAATISFTNQNDIPQLGNNALTITEGATVILNGTMLSATDIDNADPSLTFTVSSVTGGQFERISTGTVVTSFTQADITAGDIQFVHDGTEAAPMYSVSVSDGSLSTTAAAATISFTNQNDIPQLGNNALTITEGATVILNGTMLSATDIDNADPGLTFTVSSVTGGQFERISTGTLVTSFTQADVTAGDIQFVHDGNEVASSYDVSVSDGSLSTTAAAANITFTNQNDIPSLGNNTLTINEGATVILNGTMLSATDIDNADPGLTFTVSSITGGQFERISTGTVVTSFTQADITAGDIQFVHDGNEAAPTYSVSVSDGSLSTTAAAATISFTNQNDIPTLGNNTLTITEGATIVLDGTMLSATDIDNADSGLTFTVSSITGGQFERISTSTVVTSFTQADVTAGDIQFVHDGNEAAPTYSVSVSDGSLSTTAAAATISFTNQNDIPILGNNNLTITEGATVVLDGTMLSATDIDNADPGLTFTVSSITGGQFERISTSTVVTSFTQSDITAGDVQFVHDGNEAAPTYSVSVSDGSLSTTAAAATISFTNQNDIPTITSTEITTVVEGNLYSYSFTASDVDLGDNLTLSAPTLPSWLSFNASTGLLSGTPTNAEVGTHNVVLRVTDGTVNVDQSFTITVTNSNGAPTVIVLDSLNVAENSTGEIIGNLSTSDPDAGDTHSYTVSDARFEVVAGQLKLKIGQSLDFESEPSVAVTITSTDAGGLSTNQLFTLTVTNANENPVVVDDTLAANANNSLTLTTEVDLLTNDADVDGDTLNLSTFTQPTNGVLVDNGDGTLTYTPNNNFSGTDSFDYTISDGNGGTASGTAFVHVVAQVFVPVTETPVIEPEVIVDEPTETVEDVTEEKAVTTESPAEQAAEIQAPNEDTAVSNTIASSTSITAINPYAAFSRQFRAAQNSNSSISSSNLSALQTLSLQLQANPLDVLRNAWGSLDISALSVNEYNLVRGSFDAIQQEIGEKGRIENVIVGSAIATSMGLSAGYVIWMLKGGSLLASVLSSMPAWHLADPLSILSGLKQDDEDDESLESIISQGSDQSDDD